MPNIYIILTIVFSSLIKGVTGFGFALLSLPILLNWYNAKEIIPVLMICNLVASLFIILQKKDKKLIDKSSTYLIISGGIFTIFGVMILKYVNTAYLIHISGIVFIVLTILSLLNNKSEKTSLPILVYPLTGAIIGLITGIISISGPPLALFLNKARFSNDKFREIFAWFSIVTASVAIIAYFQIGLLTNQVFKLSLLFSPILLSGTILGKYLNRSISINSFRTVNIILTFISCLLLLYN
nr:sulfite exporter TauE/SafE family protein [uncultured Marinifilum sp.]